MQFGGVILCGGQSQRMGRAKAWLPFGTEVMLQRMVRILQSVVAPIVVVAAEGQTLPTLPQNILIARDAIPHAGPLAGLAAGFETLQNQVDAVFVTGCDTPLLQPNFIRCMLGKLEHYDIAVPQHEERVHPLAAVYRLTVLEHIQALIANQQLRLQQLFKLTNTRYVPTHDLVTIDPELHSLLNLNYESEYRLALEIAGLAK